MLLIDNVCFFSVTMLYFLSFILLLGEKQSYDDNVLFTKNIQVWLLLWDIWGLHEPQIPPLNN